MVQPWTHISHKHFFQTVALAPARALLLDYDGTLAPFHVQRNQAFPYPGVCEILSAISQCRHTRLVIISGRALGDLIPLLEVEPLPELWGSHGAERRLPTGERQHDSLTLQQQAGLTAAWGLAQQHGIESVCEVKPMSLAVHWRGLSPHQIENLRALVLEAWTTPSTASGLRLHAFDGGLELRPVGRHKGDAVQTICADLPPGALVAYLGDDLTDEDAFEALNGGKGTRVLVRPDVRDTVADIWLRPPTELLHFLTSWHNVFCNP
jgi:trehalose 6-phosphate phosphatase